MRITRRKLFAALVGGGVAAGTGTVVAVAQPIPMYGGCGWRGCVVSKAMTGFDVETYAAKRRARQLSDARRVLSDARQVRSDTEQLVRSWRSIHGRR